MTEPYFFFFFFFFSWAKTMQRRCVYACMYNNKKERMVNYLKDDLLMVVENLTVSTQYKHTLSAPPKKYKEFPTELCCIHLYKECGQRCETNMEKRGKRWIKAIEIKMNYVEGTHLHITIVQWIPIVYTRLLCEWWREKIKTI